MHASEGWEKETGRATKRRLPSPSTAALKFSAAQATVDEFEVLPGNQLPAPDLPHFLPARAGTKGADTDQGAYSKMRSQRKDLRIPS
jgi:hypothetical protein